MERNRLLASKAGTPHTVSKMTESDVYSPIAKSSAVRSLLPDNLSHQKVQQPPQPAVEDKGIEIYQQ